MSGDHFPNRYFPDGYFPGRYFQGGEQNPGAMFASLGGSGALAGTLTATSVTPEVPAVSGVGGGGGWRLHPRKLNVRRAIEHALREIAAAKNKRARKRVVKQAAREISSAIVTVPVAVAANVTPIRPVLELQGVLLAIEVALNGIESATSAVNANKAAELLRLFREYEAEARRLDQIDEEQAVAIVLALAA